MPVAAISDERDSEVPEALGQQEQPRLGPAQPADDAAQGRPFGEFPAGWDDFRAALSRYRESMRR